MENNSQHHKELISVIIPTYKRSDRILIAINSVLEQTYTPIEIIIVDDNGNNEFTETTELKLTPYIESKQIKYIKHATNKGGCLARNTGALHATGKYISFLDDDDFYETTKIEKQYIYLKNNTHLNACLCAMYRVDQNNTLIKSNENFPRGITLKEAVLNGNFFTSMLMIESEVFNKLSGFSNIPRFQDKYFIYKFLKNEYKFGILDEQLLTLVEHSQDRISLSSSSKIINALDTLHLFESNHQHLFSKKEWKYIKHRYYYMKAYNQTSGGISSRMSALLNIIQSITYYTGDFNVLKTFIKIFIPSNK